MSQPDAANEPAQAAELSATCAYVDGVYNEMYQAPGAARGHWEYVTRGLDALGPMQLQQRIGEARRLIRDNDITYNIYSDPRGMARPWELDLVPLLIESSEWSAIELGLIQRAELLNLLLKDLYTDRTVISRGLLPPELVFSHPGFLHPCVGIQRPDDRYLDIYAADLARAPDGQIMVIGDRTQAPSGAGYALENRMVLARVLPSLFRDSHVHRLAGFFRSLRARLHALAPYPTDDPRVVLLTPGPVNETYFEHAYLANYLGFTLVEGKDLLVRDGRVWFKTLEALEPVDVILRRVDDEYCDPLELREESYLGVPGLVHAARRGSVRIANPLGSSVLQNPALMAFLPGLARYFLGQDLRLGMPQTWWCGHPADCDYVLANLDALVIKPMRPEPGQRSVFPAELNAEQRAALEAQIRQSPRLFIAQQVVSLSSVPVFTETAQLEPRAVVLRSFLVAEEDSFRVMPGGLTRVAPAAGRLLVSSQAGGASKDTWVLASEPERQQMVVGRVDRVRPYEPAGSEVPSRVADDLFWVGRYAERAEGAARLLRVIELQLAEGFADLDEAGVQLALHPLLRALTVQTSTFPGFIGADADERLAGPAAELLSVATDAARTGSLAHTLQALLRASRAVRDRLSADTWSLINDIDQAYQRLAYGSVTEHGDVLDVLDALVTALVGFSGVASENMTHGQGWRFLQIGRRLERAWHTATLLRATLVDSVAGDDEAALHDTLLAVTDSLMSYRRRYRSGFQLQAVLELLLQDETNPRSVGYQLQVIESQAARLPGAARGGRRTAEQRLILDLTTQVRLADIAALVASEDAHGAVGARRAALDALLARVIQQLAALSETLSASYFRHEDQLHQMIPTRPGTEP